MLMCTVCGHAHSQEDWAYQSGFCHACGAKLEIPDPVPAGQDFTGWTAGPHPYQGLLLERAEAVAAFIQQWDTDHPGEEVPVDVHPSPKK